MKRIALATVLLLTAAALAGVGRPEGARAVDGTTPAPAESTITVTGTGSASAVPDRAQISFGVETQGATARSALSANAAEMRRVLDALRAVGVRDLHTQGVVVSPRYADGSAIAGYVATNTVTGTIGVSRAGAAIDAAVEAGANQVYGPTMSSSDAAKLYREALAAAVAEARLHAEALAAAAGLDLVRVVSVTEAGGAGPLVMAEAAKVAADGATPVVAGPQETTATVTVTFAAR